VPGEFDDPAAYRRLAERAHALDQRARLDGNRLFYLATPPTQFATILQPARRGLIRPPDGGAVDARRSSRKPFGRDLESAPG
jgi:glucose-6-phosphate 1-dehydrogenase